MKKWKNDGKIEIEKQKNRNREGRKKREERTIKRGYYTKIFLNIN